MIGYNFRQIGLYVHDKWVNKPYRRRRFEDATYRFSVNWRTDVKIASTCLGILPAAAAGAASAEVVLYENDDYNGRSLRSSNSVSNLDDNGFNDKVSSVRVRGGRWQLCADAYFRGSCVTLGPGEYPSLRAMGIRQGIVGARIRLDAGWWRRLEQQQSLRPQQQRQLQQQQQL